MSLMKFFGCKMKCCLKSCKTFEAFDILRNETEKQISVDYLQNRLAYIENAITIGFPQPILAASVLRSKPPYKEFIRTRKRIQLKQTVCKYLQEQISGQLSQNVQKSYKEYINRQKIEGYSFQQEEQGGEADDNEPISFSNFIKKPSDPHLLAKIEEFIQQQNIPQIIMDELYETIIAQQVTEQNLNQADVNQGQNQRDNNLENNPEHPPVDPTIHVGERQLNGSAKKSSNRKPRSHQNSQHKTQGRRKIFERDIESIVDQAENSNRQSFQKS